MKRHFPPNYGNNYEVQWKEGDFHVGDPVECGFDNLDYGIISFTSEDYMSVCTACGTGTDELPHRAINVVISTVVPVRRLEEHEYTKLDPQLRKGCQTKVETSSDEASEESKKHISHTLRKRIEEKPY
tara:strand:+ start:610 stop:993 length:384 start_codon:yes stop_codon:yes gene_type:complete